jgi:hypothetical protein
MIRRALLPATCLALAVPAAAADDGIKLGPITVQLFYKTSGTLSKDIIARKPAFSGWNTGVGEGDAEEPAEDLLVNVTVSNPGDDGVFLDEKVELWVTDEGGDELARREFKGLLVPYKGKVSNPLWMEDIACAGLLVFHAKFRKQVKTAQVRLDCGE